MLIILQHHTVVCRAMPPDRITILRGNHESRQITQVGVGVKQACVNVWHGHVVVAM